MVTRPKRSPWKDYGIALGVAVSVAFGIRTFVIEPYRIPTRAMHPALEPGDTIFVAKWPFGIQFPFVDSPMTSGRAPNRGEIVLYSPAPDFNRYFLKRVIALPGETVQIRKGKVSINGRELPFKEDASHPGCGTEENLDGVKYLICPELPKIEDFGPEKVPAGAVYVLGDFRSLQAFGPSAPIKPRSGAMVRPEELRGSALWIWMSIRPRTLTDNPSIFPQFRPERMFRRIQ